MKETKYSKRFDELVESSKEARVRVRKLVNEGRWREAETFEPERIKGYTERHLARVALRGPEAIRGDTVDFQGVNFLTEGSQVRRTVAYIEVNSPHSSTAGTGFLVSPHLFLTNQHVISDSNAARGAQLTFDREMDENSLPCPTTTFLLDPDAFALFSPEEELDYALIAVGRKNAGSCDLGDFGYCILSDAPDKHVIGMNVNIIQHPRGLPKMITVRNNLLTYRTDRTLLYETDTEPGSSGSPVFNDDWDLVALHHWGQPSHERKDDQGRDIPLNVNEGIRISTIYRKLESLLDTQTDRKRVLLAEALSYSRQPLKTFTDRVLSPPRTGGSAESGRLIVSGGLNMAQQSDTDELRVTIPLEIFIRVGLPSSDSVSPIAGTQQPLARTLLIGAEAIKIDLDYTNRTGYDPQFIPGTLISLPEPTGPLAGQVAPLHPEEPDASSGELKYEHFSIKMNKGKRMAMFTATNINGETYLDVDRKTGQVAVPSPEGETWFKDSRISASFFLDQSFYSDWSIYFDRGHLTRRTDPTWGTPEQAQRANADTYHFTNCSPQHFRFNQTTKYWQGAERYILEKGVLATESKKHISVFQGPIFDNTIDYWSGDVQIPSSFFKVIVWMGAHGLKSVGLIVDQLSLLSEKRRIAGGSRESTSIDVSEWRVPITQIEKRTGLDFGEKIRNVDTIKASDQPDVGSEAGILIRSFEDILK